MLLGHTEDQTAQGARIGEPQHSARALQVDLRAAEGDCLVQEAQRIAQASLRRARQQIRRCRLQLELLARRHLLQSLDDDAQADATEIEALAARDDGGQHFVRLSGGQHEDDVWRRLLQRLEQRIEGRRGQHMDLVDHVDFVAAAAAHQVGVLAQLADVVHTGIRGGVYLDDVRRVAGHDLAAGEAFVARLAVARVGAVDRLGQQARRTGLAGAARPTEEIGVGEPPLTHGVEQRAHDRLLTYQVGEGLRAPFAIKRVGRHKSALRMKITGTDDFLIVFQTLGRSRKQIGARVGGSCLAGG